MNPKTYLKSLLVILIVIGSVFMVRNQLFLSRSSPTQTNLSLSDSSFGWKIPSSLFQATGQVSDTVAYSDIRDPGGIPRGLPVRLKIPIIGVDTAIEDAYITSDGRMDVPAGSVNVAWFALGPLPGQKGSAVIGGHYGIDNGVPKVFYNLSKLKVGDNVQIVDDNNNTLHFVVRSIRLFDRNADASTVFLSNDGLAHLNIITCEGVWNRVNDSYPDRRVVFTDAISADKVVDVPSQPSIIVKPSLPETAIVETKTITSPSPASPTTITQETINSPKNTTPNTPLINIFFGNLLDGVITSLLIFSIIFFSIKIIKR